MTFFSVLPFVAAIFSLSLALVSLLSKKRSLAKWCFVAGMVVFTWLTLAGVEKLNVRVLEKFESGILSGVLCLLGLLIILFEH